MSRPHLPRPGSGPPAQPRRSPTPLTDEGEVAAPARPPTAGGSGRSRGVSERQGNEDSVDDHQDDEEQQTQSLLHTASPASDFPASPRSLSATRRVGNAPSQRRRRLSVWAHGARDRRHRRWRLRPRGPGADRRHQPRGHGAQYDVLGVLDDGTPMPTCSASSAPATSDLSRTCTTWTRRIGYVIGIGGCERPRAAIDARTPGRGQELAGARASERCRGRTFGRAGRRLDRVRPLHVDHQHQPGSARPRQPEHLGRPRHDASRTT